MPILGSWYWLPASGYRPLVSGGWLPVSRHEPETANQIPGTRDQYRASGGLSTLLLIGVPPVLAIFVLCITIYDS